MANFYIETDRPHYFAGENIKGNILANIPNTINNTQGITLKFSGLEYVKWNQKTELPKEAVSNLADKLPQTEREGKVSSKEVYHIEDLQLSQCQSQTEQKAKLRPKVIKTSDNKYFQIKQQERKNQFTEKKISLLPPGKILAGQYCFPFSIQSHENWPGSYKKSKPNKSTQIRYQLTVTLQPFNTRFQFQQKKLIVIKDPFTYRENQVFEEEVSSFYCLSKGTSKYQVSFNQTCYASGQQAEIQISIDNSQCRADVQGISLSLIHTHTNQLDENKLKSSSVLSQKNVECSVKAGQVAKQARSIRQTFKIPDTEATSRGQFFTSETFLQIQLKYSSSCHKNVIRTIPLIVIQSPEKDSLPAEFRSNWKPKLMSANQLQPTNAFFLQQHSQIQLKK